MYMTGDEVRTLSRRLPEIINSTDEELSFWMDDAFDILNNFCQQDFVYERQVTKSVRATTGTLVYLPKVLSGSVTVADALGTIIFSSNTNIIGVAGDGIYTGEGDSGVGTPGIYGGNGSSSMVELFPGNFVLGYYQYNTPFPRPTARTLYVTGDWGFAPNRGQFLYDGINALKASYTKHIASTVAHSQADTLNVLLLANATDLETAALLLNEIKGAMNSHFGDFVVHKAADPNIVTTPDVTDEASAFALLQALKGRFNAHVSSLTYHIEVEVGSTLTVGVDPASAVIPRQIRRAYLRLVQRIAIRDDAEDHRQINSPYSTETLGDGYSYDLGNGTLRNLLRPEEAHMLLPYVNRGRIVI